MDTKTIEGLFTGQVVKYRIPIYQRRYVWENNNWRHLWNDILDTANRRLKTVGGEEMRPHFTGVIVISGEGNQTREIVDGQQRLTTFQIILCAIRDICKKLQEEQIQYTEIVDYIEESLIGRPHGDLPFDEYCKLLPTLDSDRIAFQGLIAGNAASSSGLIHDAYVYFKKVIEIHVGKDFNKMSNLYNVFLEDIQVVALVLKKGERAAKIFGSLNGRGRALSQFDHLRNNVFLRAGKAKQELYESHWKHFNSESYWLSDEEVVDSFLVNFLKAKLGPNFDNKLPYFDLYQRNYCRLLQEDMGCNEEDEKFIKREFGELAQYSRTYQEINNCSQDNQLWFYKFLTDKFNITSWHPLILLLKSEKDKLKISDENLKLTLRILESYLVRCMLCYRPESICYENPSVQQNPIIGENGLIVLVRNPKGFSPKSLVDHLTNLSGKQKWPIDDEIKDSLHNTDAINTNVCRYILFGIEKELASNLLDVPPRIFEEWLNREHIMPRGWEQSHLDPSKRNWPLPDIGYAAKARERDKWLKSIGNLTLLHKDLNHKVGNRSFRIKKFLYEKYSGLLLTRYILECPTWDLEDIKKREQILYNRFLEIWPSSESFKRVL